MSELTDEQRAILTGPEARMQGYYIGFERTGNVLVDQILSAVAYAAKGSHSTEGWGHESEYGYGPVRPGESFEWLIQQAANDAAERLAEQGAEEPDWEFSWAGTDDEGDDWVMDDTFDTRESAEAYTRRPIGGWVRTDHGKLVRRRKAGPWMPVEGEAE